MGEVNPVGRFSKIDNLVSRCESRPTGAENGPTESVEVGSPNPLGEETAPLRSWSETAFCRDINLDLQAC